MKTHNSPFLYVLFVLCSFFCVEHVAALEIGKTYSKDDYSYTILTQGDNPTVSIKAKSGVTLSGTIFLQSSINLSDYVYTIVGVTKNGFKGQKDITAIVIPSSITTINDSAFYGCTGLTKVQMGSSESSCQLKSIGRNAFYGCSALTEVYCYGGLEAWLGITFTGNNYSNPTSIAGKLHIDGFLLKQVLVPESITVLSNFAFYGITSLTEITLHENVTGIGQYSFSKCTGLTSIVTNRSTPPTAYTNTFNNITPENVVVTLPDVNNRKAYKVATGWNAFTNFLPEPTFTKEKESTTLTVGPAGGRALLSETKNDSIIRVYSNMKHDSMYVVSCPDWVSYTVKNYVKDDDYQRNFVFTCEPAFFERIADVVIGLKGTNSTFTWTLTQQAPTLYPNGAMEGKTALTIPAEGDTVRVDGVETGKIYLYSNVDVSSSVLNVTSSADWVVINKGFSVANAVNPFIRLTLSSQTMSKEDRTATVTVSFKSNSEIFYTYTITQTGAGGLTANNEYRTLVVGPEGGFACFEDNNGIVTKDSILKIYPQVPCQLLSAARTSGANWFTAHQTNYTSGNYRRCVFKAEPWDGTEIRTAKYYFILRDCDTITYIIRQNPSVVSKDITLDDGDERTITVSDVNETSVIVVNNGILTISEPVTVQTFRISAHAGADQSGQLVNANNLTVTGETSIDITFDMCAAGKTVAEQWHAFSVPFPVDALHGLCAIDGTPLINERDYAIMVYDGETRALGKYGWKKFHDTMQPGVFYLITINAAQTIRFKKSTTGTLSEIHSMDIHKYASTTGANDHGWNGIGNPQWVYGSLNVPVQILSPSSYTFLVKPAGTVNFAVGTPFFYQASDNGSLVMQAAGLGAALAPRRVAETIKNMDVCFSGSSFSDHLYVTVAEDALSTYETGKDLAKMYMTSAPAVPQVMARAYNTNLCMISTPLVNDEARVALRLYAPQNGQYTLSIDYAPAEVYLLYNDMPVWNLSENEYVMDLEKGNNDGYTLLIRRSPALTTHLDNVGETTISEIQKIIVDNQIYIIRDGQTYNILGAEVK